MSADIEFRRLDPELYRHPLEREAGARLEKIPGFSRAVEFMREGWGGKGERRVEIASMARVGTGVYPSLDSLWRTTLDRFGLSPIPLHVSFGDPRPASVRGGGENPAVVVDRHALDAFPEAEMAALLAMQAAAVRLGHADRLAAAERLRWAVDFAGIAGMPTALATWGMEAWRQCASFSADRAAALSLGGPEAVLAFLARISGADGGAWGGIPNPDQLRIQGVEAMSLSADRSNSRWSRFTMAMNRRNHSGLVRRVAVQDWFETGEPARILSGKATAPPAPDPAADASEDPGLAYWGEFAPGTERDECGKDAPCPMAEFMGAAEKGWNAFLKAGGNFLKTFQ